MALKMICNPKFSGLKLRANGMLWPDVYKKIYTKTKLLPDFPFVDIGSASGATTIAAALAFEESGKENCVIGVEKCEGGSRARYGDYMTNYTVLTENISKYRVDKNVKLHAESLRDMDQSIWTLIQSDVISGFLHDADGRLYRDFQLFYDAVVPEGLIAVDDCPQGESAVAVIERGYSGKFIRTAVQWEFLRKEGFVEEVERCGNFVFATKPRTTTREVPVDELKRLSAEADATAGENL